MRMPAKNLVQIRSLGPVMDLCLLKKSVSTCTNLTFAYQPIIGGEGSPRLATPIWSVLEGSVTRPPPLCFYAPCGVWSIVIVAVVARTMVENRRPGQKNAAGRWVQTRASEKMWVFTFMARLALDGASIVERVLFVASDLLPRICQDFQVDLAGQQRARLAILVSRVLSLVF